MGVELENIKEGDNYRKHMKRGVLIGGTRLANPLLHKDFMFNMTPNRSKVAESSSVVHSFIRNIVSTKREHYLNTGNVKSQTREDDNV